MLQITPGQYWHCKYLYSFKIPDNSGFHWYFKFLFVFLNKNICSFAQGLQKNLLRNRASLEGKNLPSVGRNFFPLRVSSTTRKMDLMRTSGHLFSLRKYIPKLSLKSTVVCSLLFIECWTKSNNSLKLWNLRFCIGFDTVQGCYSEQTYKTVKIIRVKILILSL